MSERDELVARLRKLREDIDNHPYSYKNMTRETAMFTIEAAIKALSSSPATAATEPFRWLVEYPNGVQTYLTHYEYLYHDGYRTEPTKDTPLYAAPVDFSGTSARVEAGAIRNAALEEAEKLCDENGAEARQRMKDCAVWNPRAPEYYASHQEGIMKAHYEDAAAIRALRMKGGG